MRNTVFDSIDDFNDVRAKRQFHQRTARGDAPDIVLEELAIGARDNSRTPMQWDATPHAGFSSAAPWLKANPTFTEINVAQQVEDPRSIVAFYRRLIALRKAEPTLVYGRYELLMADDTQIYAYARSHEGGRIAILCNLSGRDAQYREHSFKLDYADLLLANHEVEPHLPTGALLLRPYEARVYRIG